MKNLRKEQGSALVEAAIVFPVLILAIYWSAALTDIMVLKLKAAEAVRYALFETTVFKDQTKINQEISAKFVDLRSPTTLNNSYTGLLMYPLAKNIQWRAAVDTSTTKVTMNGPARTPGGTGLDAFLGQIAGALGKVVDVAVQRQKFNTHGAALARVVLVRATHDEQASPILKGGDLLGARGGNDLDHPHSMTNFTFQAPLPSEKPMQMVFDTWKAWPKPAAYTLDGAPTNVSVSPRQTYPTVEDQVSKQVKAIAFFGLNSYSWFQKVDGFFNKITGFGLTTAVVGGHMPDIFSVERMDNGKYGPITILPPEKPDASWVPGTCMIMGSNTTCPSQRVGSFTSSATSAQTLPDDIALGPGVDRTRYTLPYRINTDYWRDSGGTDDQMKNKRMTNAKAALKTNNEYVLSYKCRGHYFAGSQKAEEADISQRYGRSCYK